MKKLCIAALVVGLVGLAGTAGAANEDKGPTGTWKWTVERKGNKVETTAKIKVDGEKVTGTVSSNFGGKDQEAKIDEGGTFKGGEISFSVTREFKDQKFTTKYTGKVSGDTIEGKSVSKRGDKDVENDWKAKRAVVKD